MQMNDNIEKLLDYQTSQHNLQLLGLLDQLGISQTFLVGISVGGMIALDFAANWPERVHAMVLCDTAPIIGTADL